LNSPFIFKEFKVRININKLFATLPLVIISLLIQGCGSSPLDAVVDLGKGTRAAFNAWAEQGGMNKQGNNKLHGIAIESISISYFKGEYGTGPANVELKTYAPAVDMRKALSKVCGVGEDQFQSKNDRFINGEASFSRDGKDYICYYEVSSRGDWNTMLVLAKIKN
jgi:hypothetical protein